MKKKIIWAAIAQWLLATFVLGTFALGVVSYVAKHNGFDDKDVYFFVGIIFFVYMTIALLLLLFQNRPFTAKIKAKKQKSKKH